MTIYPAIDLMAGRAVRLRQGAFDHRLDVDAEPIEAARRWQNEGAQWLHVVDLDGALTGQPRHRDVVLAICRAVQIPVQVGGGLRTMADIDAAFAAGAARVVLSTAALAGDLFSQAVGRYGEGVAVALDVRDGLVVTEGWQKTGTTGLHTAAALLMEQGARRFIYTDVRRDGMLAGPDLAGLAALIARVNVPVVVSGGIRSVADLRAAAQAGAEGAIIGRALYDGRLTLRDALGAAVEAR